MNLKMLGIALVVLLLSVISILYAFNRPCDTGPLIEDTSGQLSVIEPGEGLKKTLCLANDPFTLIFMIIGVAGLFWSIPTGLSSLVK